MPAPAEVLCHDRFQFSNGTFGKKLIVVLNNPKSRDPCIVVKTTSQSRRYQGIKSGCNPEKRVFYLPDTGKEVIRGDTYIQLEETFELSVPEMTASVLRQELRSIGQLSALTLAQIKNCLKKFREDISDKHYKMIFK